MLDLPIDWEGFAEGKYNKDNMPYSENCIEFLKRVARTHDIKQIDLYIKTYNLHNEGVLKQEKKPALTNF